MLLLQDHGAIPLCRRNLLRTKKGWVAFVREAESSSALSHPNIITIYEIGESDDTHFIATVPLGQDHKNRAQNPW